MASSGGGRGRGWGRPMQTPRNERVERDEETIHMSGQQFQATMAEWIAKALQAALPVILNEFREPEETEMVM